MLKQVLVMILLFTSSCEEVNNKLPPSKSSDTILNQKDILDYSISNKIITEKFDIDLLVPQFRNSSYFHKVSGIKVTTGVQKSFCYSIYKIPKQILLDSLGDWIKVNLCNSKSQGNKPLKFERLHLQDLFDRYYDPEEDNYFSQQSFYKFKYLKGYEIYNLFTPNYFHQLVFDLNSDTVYHRITEVIY